MPAQKGLIVLWSTLGLVAALGLALLAAPLGADATHAEPVPVPGSSGCPARPGLLELRVEPVAGGRYSDGTLGVGVRLVATASGPAFDWVASQGVDAVIVKGGPGANVYGYRPEQRGDTGLHAPADPASGQYYGLEYGAFCYELETATPSPTASPSASGTATPSPTSTPAPTATATPTSTATATATQTATATPPSSGNVIVSPDTLGNVGQTTSLALDAGGNPVVSYYDLTSGDLKVLHCGNPTCTNGNSIVAPDTVGDVGAWTSLRLDSAGNPVVSYHDIGSGLLKVMHCGNPTCTAGNTMTVPDAVRANTFTSLTLDAAGNPIVAYIGESGAGRQMVLHCGNPSCTSGNTIASPGYTARQSVSLVLDAVGNPVIAFDGAVLALLYCGDSTCTSGNSTTLLDSQGFGAVLALDAAGNPVVAYSKFPDESLSVVHCGNPTCTSGNIVSAVDPGNRQHLSLALDSVGNPVVAYYAIPELDLKVLHCGDPTCSAGSAISSPDTLGDVGSWTSIGLDAGGNPVVSYWDFPNADLKVLHCGNPTCS